MRRSVECARIDDAVAHANAVPVYALGHGVRDDIGSPLEGPTVDRRRERVVHDERHTVRVRHVCEMLAIGHRERRIGDHLAEDYLGVGPKDRHKLLARAIKQNEREFAKHDQRSRHEVAPSQDRYMLF